jgi:two-component system chemotaxis response regulator CheB
VIKILVVDDSALMRRLLGRVFSEQGDFEIAFARDGLEALDCLRAFQPDVVTLDIHMPNMDGLACLDRIMVDRPCPVIMVSSMTAAGADKTLEAMQLGAVDFIAKPEGAISLAMEELAPELIEKVRAALKARFRPRLRLKERLRLQTNTVGLSKVNSRSRIVVRPDNGVERLVRSAGPPDVVVLVGASTGGPPALDAILSPLPADFPWPVLVAQHMPAAFTGPLARRLDKLCALTVVEVTGPMPLVAGQVYIGKGDADIIVSMRAGAPVVIAAPELAEHRWHPSVNRLVFSAMQHLGASRLIGVLMTGMGNDGAAAMTQLKAQGGRTIAESEETAVVWGMPGELVRAGGAQLIIPLNRIAHTLLALVA